MKTMIVLMAVMMVGCGKGGAGDSSSKAADGAPTGPNLVETPSAISLTYYGLSFTEAPIAGWVLKTYTATGYCAQYLGKTYCWDDGIKTLQWVDLSGNHYGPYTYSFWGAMAGPSSCHGACSADLMSTPQYVNSTLQTFLTTTKINNVLTGGTPTTLTCMATSTQVDCGSFIITL